MNLPELLPCEIAGCSEQDRPANRKRFNCSICLTMVCGYHSGVTDSEGDVQCTTCIVGGFTKRHVAKSRRIPSRATLRMRHRRKRDRKSSRNATYFTYLDAFVAQSQPLINSAGIQPAQTERQIWFWKGYRDDVEKRHMPNHGTVAYDCWCAGMDSAIQRHEKDITRWARGETSHEPAKDALSQAQRDRRVT